VDSSPGAGTTFRIYFPVAAGGILAHGVAQTTTTGGLTGSETVLVVEDQDTVREYAVNALRTYGYSVIAARGGADALDLAKRQAGPIDLLLTDVIMPSVNGKTVALELRKTRPETKVIYMSGYADGTVGGAGEIEPDAEYLQKPFSPEALAAKVRRTLGKSTVSRTILVVEDEAAVRDLFVEFLGKKHNLLLACDGRKALEILRTAPAPDLVITDLVMPNQEGMDLIREIRKSRPATRIIAMSGAFSGRFLKTAELLGADATLVKPIRPEVLEQVIEDVLGRR
jgi:CheY-like chemotaxis protein